ncbi:PREDICTED: extensin isoform X2 [Nicrophorus vespilloides]|uniref:Extensin isoform X2 n=1 Tax=Nicrophorus vespilloides TaxID=110193 RepID=A0ABM1NEP0_NICVS|nr:PREDICTED: extensin isoform X2 [Nicrophorus vespilloides]
MPPKSFFWVLLLIGFMQIILVESNGHRTLHRLVGGHLSVKPDLDDTELIITSSAGGGREGKQKKGEDGDEKKTLSQQVADGKYGLIQKELFSKPVKKSGVISYESNPEVPLDNIDNLGGLNKNDIWLAENHLLVIKGGSYPPHEAQNERTHPHWLPIDDYKAPSRQVKIPANPKVPPPFPVQLTEGGPLQILGTNTTTTLNGSLSAKPYPLPAFEAGGFFPPLAPGNPYSPNFTSGETPFPIPPFPPSGDYGPPFPPFPINGSLPPFLASLPPGAAILPPPGNFTEYDEDDPSIYYPPPYSFYYQMDNTTAVPPGPLVPGIVLPPPPNFFAPLEKTRKPQRPIKNQMHRTTTTTTQRPTTTTEIIKQIHPTTTPLPPTPINKPSRIKPTVKEPTTTQAPIITILPVRYLPKPNRTYIPVTTTQRPNIPERRKRPPAVTILRPVKPSTTSTQRPPVFFYENNEVANGRPFKIYGPPHPSRTVISSTQIPLKAYYSTSNDIDTNSVTQRPANNVYRDNGISTVQVPKTTKPPAQYYFYEEAVTNSITTPRTPKQRPNEYYNIPKEYYIPSRQTVRGNYQQANKAVQPPQQYYYVTNRPARPSRYRFIETTKKPDTFSVHVARLKQQIHQYYTTPDPYYDQRPHSSSKPVYQFSFQAANYQPKQNQFRPSPIDEINNNQDKFRPLNKYNVQIQPAIEVLPTERPVYQQNTPAPVYYQQKTTRRPNYYSTVRPEYEYEEIDDNRGKNEYVATPRPISQYSFEATPNPIYQPYYTKQDDSYFDDITKKHFTVFGKKLPGATTPLSRIEATTSSPQPQQPVYNNKNIPYEYTQEIGQRPNPQAEYLPRNRQPIRYQQQQQPQLSLESDINVNYKHPKPPVNPDAEIVQAIPVKLSANNGDKRGSYISYELPGDNGAHFYFLTPQLAQSRDQGAGYYYSNPESRIRRSQKDSE